MKAEDVSPSISVEVADVPALRIIPGASPALSSREARARGVKNFRARNPGTVAEDVIAAVPGKIADIPALRTIACGGPTAGRVILREQEIVWAQSA